MRFAVVGSRGMFGAEMLDLLGSRGKQVTGFHRGSMDLSVSPQVLSEKLSGFDVIVNAVAYTAVDKAESEVELANLVNGEYAGKLALAAALVGAKIIHISTDYVFDGSADTPYSTLSPTNPKTAYGNSKLLGERLVSESGADYTIFRTAWLYGRFGRCFPKVIFEKHLNNEVLKVVNNQVGQPTWTKDLATQVLAFSELAETPTIVHAVSSGVATWFDFAKEVVGDYFVEPVSSSEFITAAKRPSYSVLDNSSSLVQPIENWRQRWEIAKSEVLQRPESNYADSKS
jgi:dTDP-4-dehydrorhamnose reductase